MLTTDGGSAIIDDLTLTQTGTGDLLDLDTGTAFAVFRNSPFIGGAFRIISVNALLISGCAFVFGGRLVVDGAANFGDLRVVGSQFVDNLGVQNGVFLIEDGAVVNNFVFSGCFITMLNNSTAVRFGNGINIGNIVMEKVRFTLLTSAGVGVRVEDPDDIRGKILDSNLTNTGTLTACTPEDPTIFASPDTEPRGITQDNDGNLIIADAVASPAGTLTRMVLISSTEESTIESPSSNPTGLAWFRADLYSVDNANDLIYNHTGFSETIKSTIVTPGGNCTGITFMGENLVSIDSTTNNITLHDGFTTVVLQTIASPTTDAPLTVSFDGVNLIVGDQSGNVFVMEGFSTTVLYSFDSGTDSMEGMGIIFNPTGFAQGLAMTNDSTNMVHLFEHPITFDHSSATWLIEDVSGAISSADRGGSFFDGDFAFIPALTIDVWVDIISAGNDIAYALFEQNEKIRLNDELNGEVMFLGVRERSCSISAQVTITRDGSQADRAYELSISVDGKIIKDSIAQGVLFSNTAIVTITTVPISRTLVKGSLIKSQFRLTEGTPEDTFVSFSKISII